MAHPERLGKYQITGVLGEGAMGVVYRGFDPDIRRVVALKTIRRMPGDAAPAGMESAARFRNEAQAAGRLMHPGIVGVYDFGDDGRVAYIAMEYIEGHTLALYLAQRVRFTEADVASVAVQLAEALAHAHDNGVIHRDIKPSNVIMTKSGRVKIADFGIARTDNSGLTMANSVLGTPMYMAPEQFMGRPIDHRVDLYAVGVVLYQMLAGRAPFVGPPEALMYKVVNEAPLPPSAAEHAPHGPRFDAVVAQALAKDPAQRPVNATALREAVAAALGAPVPPVVAREAVYALPPPTEYAPTERIRPLAPGSPAALPAGASTTPTATPPTHWDPAVLAQVESSLARHVGPLAAVLVRRAARECLDLPQLQARLAEQITNAAARDSFLGRRTAASTGSHGTTRQGGMLPAQTAPAPATGGSVGSGASGGTPVSDAWIEQAQKLLAVQLGPIARVVVKRAAERTRRRADLSALLAEAVPEAARQRLLAELARLA
ncbi:Protein kinase domain-containing protein [Rubrivivax sp. A210]|uniref:serine/threonine-protein kinase n=1 Tax=Rubrivivax sp. A210 TaxID=2772301 RepID=UPI00191A4BB0|nr:serine/threonine-protein kinase [Rubrivivax sp. A210]CAD5372695.1 Protein kinase domain-containing protein [Rubrivivax sp. A210]